MLLTDGRGIVRGKLASRITNPNKKGGPKRADYVLFAQQNHPIAVIEAKSNQFTIGHGMQQALDYAEMLDVPFAFSSNGDGFLFHDMSGLTQPVEREIELSAFPTLEELLPIYLKWKGLEHPLAQKLIKQPYPIFVASTPLSH